MLLGGVLVAAVAVIAVVVVDQPVRHRQARLGRGGHDAGEHAVRRHPADRQRAGRPGCAGHDRGVRRPAVPLLPALQPGGPARRRQGVREDRAGEDRPADAHVHRRGLRARRARGVVGGRPEQDVRVRGELLREPGGGELGLRDRGVPQEGRRRRARAWTSQKALDGRDSAKVSSSIQGSQTSATKANVDSTPSFLVGPSDGTLSKIESRTLTIDDFREPVKDALAEAKSNQ